MIRSIVWQYPKHRDNRTNCSCGLLAATLLTLSVVRVTPVPTVVATPAKSEIGGRLILCGGLAPFAHVELRPWYVAPK